MIIYAAYREWALNSAPANLSNLCIVRCSNSLLIEIEKNAQSIEAIIFVGWSNKVQDWIVNRYVCVCFHPSDLPKFRGGSPIQNQIIAGVEYTKATLFKMTTSLDAGPIFSKQAISLLGELDSVLKSISEAASILVVDFILTLRSGREICYEEQNESEATFYKRRSPDLSEISQRELCTLSGKALYNRIRALGDPYPNAFIRTIDGRRLIIKKVELA